MSEGKTESRGSSAAQCSRAGLRLTRRGMLQASAGTAAALASVPTFPFTAGAATGEVQVGLATVTLSINGRHQTLTLDPRQSLLDLLRETLDLTGTKKGCNTGACGACTVIVNGRRVNACLNLAAILDGAEVTTIEGLALGDDLHPMQAAFIEHDGLQCGYCTPGQILSGVSCIAEGHAGSVEDIKFWMSGNICRCGAYPGIVAAVAQVAGAN